MAGRIETTVTLRNGWRVLAVLRDGEPCALQYLGRKQAITAAEKATAKHGFRFVAKRPANGRAYYATMDDLIERRMLAVWEG